MVGGEKKNPVWDWSGDGEVDREVREDRSFSLSLQVTVSWKRGGQHWFQFFGFFRAPTFCHFPDVISHSLGYQLPSSSILYTRKPQARYQAADCAERPPDPGSWTTPSSGFVNGQIRDQGQLHHSRLSRPRSGIKEQLHLGSSRPRSMLVLSRPTAAGKASIPFFWAHKLPSSASFAPRCPTHRESRAYVYSLMDFLGNPDYGLVLDPRS